METIKTTRDLLQYCRKIEIEVVLADGRDFDKWHGLEKLWGSIDGFINDDPKAKYTEITADGVIWFARVELFHEVIEKATNRWSRDVREIFTPDYICFAHNEEEFLQLMAEFLEKNKAFITKDKAK